MPPCLNPAEYGTCRRCVELCVQDWPQDSAQCFPPWSHPK
ncbi:Uncharacterised protein [Vibrio cholerae]|nr:Uncharacterised protein [Vibrio cholerae]